MKKLTILLTVLILYMPAAAATLYVTMPYPTIQSAIDASVNGDTIIIADGIYTGDGNHDIDFLGKAITLQSENGPENCIIDCENNGRAFILENHEGRTSKIIGFTIRNGYVVHNHGGAIFLSESRPTISGCIFENNSAAQTQTGRMAFGGAIHCSYDSNPLISDCIFRNNDGAWGGAVSASPEASPRIKGCQFIDNTSIHLGSALFFSNSQADVCNCLFVGNHTSGMVIWNFETQTQIVNCTFYGNEAYTYDGVIYHRNDRVSRTLTIKNTIMWNDGYKEIDVEDIDDPVVVSYSNIQEPHPGAGNISSNPRFVDPYNGNYQLMSNSPCIDAGYNSAVSGATDLDGRPRIMDGDGNGTATVDMGAYEAYPSNIPVIRLSESDLNFSAKEGGANPDDQIFSISNIGGVILNWQITESCGWLTVTPDSGSSAGEENAVTLSADITGLTGGQYTCELAITDPYAMNNPQTVNVNLDINSDIFVPSQYPTIQSAIDSAINGDTIIVAPGTYNETINLQGKGVTLRSSEPNSPELTIINGCGLGSVVTFAGGETADADCEFIGFTITGGNATGNGGGIQGNFTKAVISNCIIKNNISQNRGGGVSRCNGILDRCIIAGNAAKNRGGGVLASNCTMVNCLIYDNYVGYLESSTEGYGGGLYNCSGDVINCTIAYNNANGRAGGLDGYNGTITNCIVWGNELEQMLNCSQPTYSCIQDWIGGGMGNIDTNPLFADPNNEDYHLLADSPCIDAADPNYAAAPNATDIDGKPRIINGIVDMGAYEFFNTPPVADSGADQTVYASASGVAKVKLDGSGSYDDGTEASEPNDVLVTVVSAVEVEMKFTPQALNPGSQGKWVKAHLVLPEGFGIDDVDADTPAKIEQLDIESEYMNVFINEDGLVEIETAFRRGDFCAGVDFGPGEVTVIGRLTSGQYFYGTDKIRIITNKVGYVANLASYWLGADCGPPDWCGGLDVDQDSIVDWLDFAMSDGCCFEVIEE